MDRIRINDGFKHEKLIELPETVINWCAAEDITQDLYISRIGYFPNAGHHYFTRPQGHDEPILIFCVDGKGIIDLCGITITLEKNQLYIIPEGVPHAYQADLVNPWSIYWAHFNGALRTSYLSMVQPELQKLQILPEQHPQLIRYFDEMIGMLTLGYSQDHLLLVSSLLKTFFTALNHTSYTHNTTEEKRSFYISKAIEFMQQNLTVSMTLKDLSHHLNLSDSYLMHVFKEKTGTSPIQYYNGLKIQKVCQLLLATNHTIKEIGKELGFEDPYYFSRLFKKTMGVSPKVYRVTQNTHS